MNRFFAALVFAALAVRASANAGTPLMWAGCCYLTFANLFIGVAEAWLLNLFVRGSHKRDGTLIAANYASMVAGLALVWIGNRLMSAVSWNEIRWGWVYIGLMWIAAFLLTLIVEAPFVGKVIQAPWKSRKAFIATLKVNLVSYSAILAITGLVGSFSLYTRARFVDAGTLSVTAGTVYFVRDGYIRRIRTDGTGEEIVAKAPPRDGYLAAMPTPDDQRSGLFWVKDPFDPKPIPILHDVGGPRQTAPNARDAQGKTVYAFAQPGYFTQRDMRPADDRRWRARAGFWPIEGLRVLSTEPYSLAVETPFLMVMWRNLTLLPGDFGVVGANGWIVLVHLPTERISTLTRGTNPTVVLDEPLATEVYER